MPAEPESVRFDGPAAGREIGQGYALAVETAPVTRIAPFGGRNERP